QRVIVAPAVRIEPLVLRRDHRVLQSRRDAVERRPVQDAASLVDAQFVQRPTVAIEKHRVRAAIASAGFLERRRPRRRRVNRERQRRGEGRARRKPRPHGRTSTFALGSSPNISGEYMASTRVGGRPKFPALLNRTVYSTVKSPLGTYS